MDAYKLSDGLKSALRYSTRLNLSINEFTPWVLIRDNSNQLALYKYMGLAYRHLIVLCGLLYPFAPNLCETVANLIVVKTPNDYNFKDISFRSIINNPNYLINLPISKPSVIIKPIMFNA